VRIFLDNETDELVVQGSSVCMGYALCAKDLEKGYENQDLWHTGDVAYIDEEGYIYLKGRIARFVKVLGNRISLDEIEKYLKDKFIIDDFACVGIDESIEIYYTGDIKREEIDTVLNDIFKIPAKFVSCYVISEIPRNESGKIQYVRLKEYRNGTKGS